MMLTTMLLFGDDDVFDFKNGFLFATYYTDTHDDTTCVLRHFRRQLMMTRHSEHKHRQKRNTDTQHSKTEGRRNTTTALAQCD